MTERFRIQQPVSNRVTVGVFAGVSSAALIVILIRVGPHPGTLGLLAVVAAHAYRVLGVEVLADAKGLRVRNFLSNNRYEWSEVEGFALGASAMPVGRGINVILTRGRTKTLEASFGRWWLGRGHLDAKNDARCEELLGQLRRIKQLM